MRSWLGAHKWAVAAAAAAFLVGAAIGAAGGDVPAEAADGPEGAPATVTETITETVAATENEEAELAERAAALDERAAKLDGREQAVKRRERKLARAERVQARSTFGDGTYLVGTDIPPGSYVAPGGELCYWERGTASGDIIDNHVGSGQARATVQAGELFDVQGCGTWRRG